MVERWPFKPMAVGSIPTEGVFFIYFYHKNRIKIKFFNSNRYLIVAQLVERGTVIDISSDP